MNFPNTHHLLQNSAAQPLLREADVILGLELADFWGTVNSYIDNGATRHGLRNARQAGRQARSASAAAICTSKSNYQDFQRFQIVDIAIAADARSDAAALIEAVKRRSPPIARRAFDARGDEARRRLERGARAHAREAAAYRLGREPDQHRAAVRRRSGRRSRTRTGRWSAATGSCQQLAAPAVADGQALSPHRRSGRLRHRLRRAGRGRRRARQQGARAASRSTSSPTAT